MALIKQNSLLPETPFYYYDMELLERTLKECRCEAQKYGYNVHYALKANVEQPILEMISRMGFGADCVSGWVVEAALNSGFKAEDVVFAGVGKSDAEIELALEHDIFSFNSESLEEIEVINEIAQKMGKVARIALRINPNVEPDTHKYIATGQSASKFGISYPEIKIALSRIEELSNIKIVGIHFHIGSGIVNMNNFKELALKVNEINDWFLAYGVDVQHLNMGGGLGINYTDPDSELVVDFGAYFRVFAENLTKRENQTIHFELGRSIVAQCGDLVTKVLYSKETASGEKFLIVDAGMTELIRPALYSASHRIENISAEGKSREMDRYYIGGPICESSDVFAHDIEFPRSGRGDYLAIRSIGAYGSIMSSHYNLRPTAKSYFSLDFNKEIE